MLILSLTRKLTALAKTTSQMPIVPGIVKLVRFLITYCCQNGTENGSAVTVALTREALSYNLGLSIRTINRLIQNLKDQNAVTVRNGKIRILPEQIEQLYSFLSDFSNLD